MEKNGGETSFKEGGGVCWVKGWVSKKWGFEPLANYTHSNDIH